MATCKLCQRDKQLINRSHIIPEFFYEEMYDENHKLRFFSPNELQKGTGFVKKPSLGLYEGGLLCKTCEGNVLSVYENYGRKALKGGTLPYDESPKVSNGKTEFGHGISICKDMDYTKYKLMLLSILWRASISKNDFFKEVNLGEHEEIIRKMIWEGNAGAIDDYPIVQMTYRNDKTTSYDFIAQPRLREVPKGFKAYVFFFSGGIYNFYIKDTTPLPEFVLDCTIKPTNEMKVYQIPEGRINDLILAHYEIRV